MNETNKGEIGMRCLTSRFIVALLTFAIGISAAFLWLYYRPAVDTSRTAQSQPSASLSGEQQKASDTSSVRWIYIATPLDMREDAFAFVPIIALSVDGKWLRTFVLVERENGKLKLSDFGHNLIAKGTWKQNTGQELSITVESCRCDSESAPLDGGHQVKYPFATRWSLTKGALGQRPSMLHTSHEKFRLLQRDELAADNIDDLLDASLRAVGNEKDMLSRRCLKEDVSIFN